MNEPDEIGTKDRARKVSCCCLSCVNMSIAKRKLLFLLSHMIIFSIQEGRVSHGIGWPADALLFLLSIKGNPNLRNTSVPTASKRTKQTTPDLPSSPSHVYTCTCTPSGVNLISLLDLSSTTSRVHVHVPRPGSIVKPLTHFGGRPCKRIGIVLIFY